MTLLSIIFAVIIICLLIVIYYINKAWENDIKCLEHLISASEEKEIKSHNKLKQIEEILKE